MNQPHKGTILVVDDEALKRATLDIDLSAAGYHVIQAPDGRTAMQYLEDHHVDVVVADLRMPEMSGLQLLDRIKAHSPELPVVLMTAFSSIDTAVQAIKRGAYDYVSKPFTTDLLVAKLDRLRSNGQGDEDGDVVAEMVGTEVAEQVGGNGNGDTLCCGALKLTEAVAGVERSLIDAALRRAAGNQAKAAQFLGIPRTTLRDKMTKYGFGAEATRSEAN